MNDRRGVFLAVLRSPVLRRIELAFLAFSVAEWATWVAVVVYAYGRGGAAEAGVVAAIQLVPSVVVAPAAASLGDRYPRSLVLVGTYLLQSAAMAAAAVALLANADARVVYALATVTATAITLTRPLQSSLVPDVVRTPDELTAANVASGTVESAGSLVGPVLASVLIALGGPGLVFAACAAGMLVSAASLLTTGRRAFTARRTLATARAEAGPAAVPEGADVQIAAAGFRTRLRAELVGGLTAIIADRRLLAVAALGASGWLMLGALDIFYAVLAIDVLGLGEEGVGQLGAATGVGMLVGSGASVALVGRRHLAAPLVAAAAAFGVSIAAIGLVPQPAAVAVMLGVAGASSIVLYVAGQTATQRYAPPVAMTRVFGVLEGTLMLMTALGALMVPVLVAIAGPTGALVIAGLILPMVALMSLRALREADRTLVLPDREIALLRGVSMFAPLGPRVIEQLARALVPLTVPAGRR